MLKGNANKPGVGSTPLSTCFEVSTLPFPFNVSFLSGLWILAVTEMQIESHEANIECHITDVSPLFTQAGEAPGPPFQTIPKVKQTRVINPHPARAIAYKM